MVGQYLSNKKEAGCRKISLFIASYYNIQTDEEKKGFHE
jgi:hypothetical protein